MFRQDWDQEELSQLSVIMSFEKKRPGRKKEALEIINTNVAIVMKLPVCQEHLYPLPLIIITVLHSRYYCPLKKKKKIDEETEVQRG